MIPKDTRCWICEEVIKTNGDSVVLLQITIDDKTEAVYAHAHCHGAFEVLCRYGYDVSTARFILYSGVSLFRR